MNVIQVINEPDPVGIDLGELADPAAARRAFRKGLKRQTGGVAPGYVQGNLCILPAAFADDFLRFCQRNPSPCPVLAVSEPGDPRLPELGADLDIRTDIPSYRVWRDGELAETVADVRAHWRKDLVTFVLGCSFSFEQALVEDGLPLPHLVKKTGVPMYLTSIETVPAGPFRGQMVVSMRSFTPRDAIRAIQITSRFPRVHGAPVHIGHPHLIGITDMAKEAFGYKAEVPADHLPLFWGCGVTPQSVVRNAKPPICITHEPAYMLVTDLRNAALASF